MYDDIPARAGSLRRLSLDELATYAIKEQLIDGVDAFDDRVVITQGDHRFVLPPKQASTFLIGMLRGRSWYVEDDPAVTSRAGTTSPLRSLSESDVSSDVRPIDSTLKSLLAFTREVGIIKGFEQDKESRSVRIDISVCSTDLSYLEAVNYLFDCIQHEMRTLNLRKTPGRSPSLWTNEQ